MTVDHNKEPRTANRVAAAALTATPLWIPAGVVIGTAAATFSLGQTADGNGPIDKTHRNLLRTSGVTTCAPEQARV